MKPILAIAAWLTGLITSLPGGSELTLAQKPTPWIEGQEQVFVAAERADPSLVAETNDGKLHGVRRENGVVQFRGIPFAMPPVGELRYAPPQPAGHWEGILQATKPAPRCPQIDNAFIGPAEEGMAEDCLWLNVTTPALDDAQRPVMVWIHGGGLHSGSAGEATYDGSILARRGDVVVVNLQYRLGVWGYMDLSHLGEPDLAMSGVFGQRDQLLGLKWVHDNIAAFGGDPGNVTVFGESAGSYSVASLTRLPEAQSYFQKTILMSGVFNPTPLPLSKAEIAKKFMGLVEANSLADLRSADPRDILKAQAKLSEEAAALTGADLQAFIDPPAPSLEDFRTLGELGKPVLHGTTANEWHFFTLLMPPSETVGRDMAYLSLSAAGLDSTDIERMKDLLQRHDPNRSDNDLYIDLLTGIQMIYPHDQYWKRVGTSGTPVWQYVFDWTSPLAPELGAFHAIDLGFTFGTLSANADLLGETTSEMTQLSEQFQDALVAFARTGTPDSPDLPVWPQYDEASKPVMSFGKETRLVNDRTPWLPELSVVLERSLAK